MVAKGMGAISGLGEIISRNPLPSFHPQDLLVGLIGAACIRAAVYIKAKNAKKYRHGVEYGSARWGNAQDIAPFINPRVCLKTVKVTRQGYRQDRQQPGNKGLSSRIWWQSGGCF